MTRPYTISAFTENTPGVLHRITALFTRRKVNVESLTVSETEKKGISRFTIVVHTDSALAIKIARQIRRIIEVIDVFVADNSELLFKEIALYKLRTPTPQTRSSIEELAHRHQALVVHADDAFLVVEKTGSEDQISSLFRLLEPFGIEEFVRSGRIAILTGTPVVDNVAVVSDEAERSEGSCII